MSRLGPAAAFVSRLSSVTGSQPARARSALTRVRTCPARDVSVAAGAGFAAAGAGREVRAGATTWGAFGARRVVGAAGVGAGLSDVGAAVGGADVGAPAVGVDGTATACRAAGPGSPSH